MRLLFPFLAIILAACGNQPASPAFHAEGRPDLLSDWGMVSVRDGHLVLSDGVEPYDLNTPLFTDHAGKLRTIWMPEGTSATYREGQVLDFPIGTVITKTFYYPVDGDGHVLRGDQGLLVSDSPETLDLERVRLVETRLLVHREDGWVALPYVWNEDESDAQLMRAGYSETLTLAEAGGTIRDIHYLVPNVNQCAGCHATNNTTRALSPIGPAARHLNRDYAYAGGVENQLSHLIARGYLTGAPDPDLAPRAAVWNNPDIPLDQRARAYLDINCAHCHNPVGPADTSGLHLNFDAPVSPNLGLCKPPIAAGPGSGGLRFDIVPGNPEDSIFIYRMASTRGDVMMPELGRSLTHHEGVALISEWIAGLEGGCN
ncbi:SO2930 family diheme c-type cytochrome [Hyphobacterium sp. HN65]|uniref:SO2930 family diheme c-type cytochrome n=1 Tax=Hyphobacterium lacteum TaxID=3116575 RepID=A0ABU7LPG7_9PROT|nr:SO2930 family diheme c-type cytochrome [Hyphobacterium sp. HN65]MEE2525787.1 SO2930 family diheme c-type cytochrome [Hyphobacterium sp. HN65]